MRRRIDSDRVGGHRGMQHFQICAVLHVRLVLEQATFGRDHASSAKIVENPGSADAFRQS
jgi:hypothetical protein